MVRPDDHDKPISLGEAALAELPAHHPSRSTVLFHLSVAYLSRFERTGVLADADRAISLSRQAITHAPRNHPDRPGYLFNLGFAHRRRFSRTEMTDDIDQAVELCAEAVAAVPPGDPSRWRYLPELATAHRARFERGGARADIDRAIEFGEEALSYVSSNAVRTAINLSNLSVAYRVRHRQTAAAADLDRAVELGELALVEIPADHPERPGQLSNTGLAHLDRFESIGDVTDLELAADRCGTAVDSTPSTDPHYSRHCSNLAAVRQVWSEHFGAPEDLDTAITLFRRAVDHIVDDHPDTAGYLSNLGYAYHLRFLRAGVLEDINQAIELISRAVSTTPVDHRHRPGRLSNLGLAYRARFERTASQEDIVRALESGARAVDATPNNTAHRPMFLSNLAGAHVLRAKPTPGSEDLDHAISLYEEAIAALPGNHPSRPEYTSCLGVAHRLRFELAGARDDLDRAVELSTEAVAAVASDDVKRVGLLLNLGLAQSAALDAHVAVPSQKTVRSLVRQLVVATRSSPAEWIRAGFVIGSLAHATGANTDAIAVLDTAVALLHSVYPRESGWTDQEHSLAQYRGLVSEAVAAHCAVDDYEGAVRIAEQGRTVLLAPRFDLRTDLSDLADAHPDLADRVRDIWRRLDQPPAAQDEGRSDLMANRKKWWGEHDAVLHRIREQTGFSKFLMPPPLKDLAPTAGTVVMINAGEQRGDALIIGADMKVQHIPLPTLTRADVLVHLTAMQEATRQDTDDNPDQVAQTIHAMLAWLWDCAVGPIVESLHQTCEPMRVWWMPIGLLSLFPLHAAGHRGERGALDAITSYTPTLRTLHRSRGLLVDSRGQHLIIALERTPGLPRLPKTTVEASKLHARHRQSVYLHDREATSENVLATVARASWVHFACHAGLDLTTPSRSGLHLHDGLLPLSEISRLRIGSAELAYLSACSTAASGWRHPDEALHLASAFQPAGFRHVVASLWPLNDRVAAKASEAFCSDLSTADASALKLREVVQMLRNRYPDRPQLWSALIHSGP